LNRTAAFLEIDFLPGYRAYLCRKGERQLLVQADPGCAYIEEADQLCVDLIGMSHVSLTIGFDLFHGNKTIAATVTMKSLIAQATTRICSGLIHLLHNRSTFSFNRLELQSVNFSFSQFGEDLAI
jgi:hypothetical protein